MFRSLSAGPANSRDEDRAVLSDAELLALPKVDLHLHLVGSAAPETVALLAARHPAAGVPVDVAALRRFYAFDDFTHFLNVYAAITRLLRTAEDIQTLVVGLGADLHVQNVIYAEVTVTPVPHAAAGIAPADLAAALDTGAAQVRVSTGIEIGWVYDISGADGPPGAQATLDAALNHPPARLVGFGLGGPEAGVRRTDYADVFAAARAAGLHSVPHAGETTGPGEVWSAVLDLHAERIGHGIAAAADPRLLDHLAEHNVTLEVCPSSNVATGAVRSLTEHPLPTLLAAGVPVTLGSDDPPMFATSLLDEYQRARDVLGLHRAQLLTIAATGARASYAPSTLQNRLLRALTARSLAGEKQHPILERRTSDMTVGYRLG
jgi:aminodeoxyfutalosine deaminase